MVKAQTITPILKQLRRRLSTIWKSKDHLIRGIKIDDPNQSETNEVYADEPLVEEEWLAHYEEEMKVERKLEKKLAKRGTQKVWD